MATVSTSTNAIPLERPNHALFDRDPATGYLYAHFKSSTANRMDTFRSTDAGASWASYATLTRANIAEMGGIWVTDNGLLVWITRINESSEDRIYMYVLDLSSATWGPQVLLANPSNGGVGGAFLTGLDFAVVRSGADLCIALAVGLNNASGKTGINLYGAKILASGVYEPFNALFSGASRSQYETGTTGRITPSVDIEHNGDGRTSSTPHLWVCSGRLKQVVLKCTWGGSGWSIPTAGVQIAVPSPALEAAPGRWDGNQFVAVRPSGSTVKLSQRNRANTTTTEFTTGAHPQGTVKNCAVNYDSSTGDARVFAVATTTNDLYWCDFTRATLTFGSWTLFSATDIEGTRRDQYAIRRGSAGDSAHDVLSVADTTGVITHTAQTLSYAPTAPMWIGPENGAAADVAAALALDWSFQDPNPGDTQSAYAVSRQIGAGALAYWRASDSTWQPAEVQNTSGSTSLTLASGWGADVDPNYTYKVKTWDATNLPSPYSDALVVVPSAVANPTITAPTAAQVLAVNFVAITWTVSAETAYRVRLVQTAGGSVTYDSGWITGTDLAFTPPVILPNGSGWTITLNTRNAEGLSSADVTRSFTVSYVPPMTPTLVCSPAPSSGYIGVAITNPTPGGGAPALTDQDLYRRPVGDVSNGVQVASGLGSGAAYNDWRAASGTAYEYRVQAFGVNGTSTFSAWTA